MDSKNGTVLFNWGNFNSSMPADLALNVALKGRVESTPLFSKGGKLQELVSNREWVGITVADVALSTSPNSK